MRGLRRIAAYLALLVAPLGPLTASEAPLSIIDWLETEEDAPRPATAPPVAPTATQPQIVVQPLGDTAKAVGLVPASVTGFPVTLWQNSDPMTLSRMIANAPVENHPALQALLYSLLLTEAVPHSDPASAEKLMLARIDKLLALGALDPAQALTEAAGASRSPALFARWTDTAFLSGGEDAICAALDQSPHLAPDQATLIFCVARRGDLNRATLLFDASLALDQLTPQMAPALDRFLHPELFEEAAPLPQPRAPGPLLFRLYEAIGERLPTASLPRRFAAADLRDVAGWKAQLEAAERLARTGAISSNTLLGLYTERLPAASGGIWDRVAALQRFETALGTGSPDAIAKTLQPVWRHMAKAGLTAPFADLFADPLTAVATDSPAMQSLMLKTALMSPAYESLARDLPANTRSERFWIALSQGTPSSAPATRPMERAIAAGFAPAENLPRAYDASKPGESILLGIRLFDSGAAGNLGNLTQALQVFRALGLDDVARRAALHVLIGKGD